MALMSAEHEVPPIVREAESFLAAFEPGDVAKIKGLISEGYSYIAITGFDLREDADRVRMQPIVQRVFAAFREHAPHTQATQNGTTALYLGLAPTMDAANAAMVLSQIKDDLTTIYPDGGGQTIGVRMPPPPTA